MQCGALAWRPRGLPGSLPVDYDRGESFGELFRDRRALLQEVTPGVAEWFVRRFVRSTPSVSSPNGEYNDHLLSRSRRDADDFPGPPVTNYYPEKKTWHFW